MITMNSISESAWGSEDWEVAEDGIRPGSMIVQLRRSMHVFPWFRFAHAHGDGNKIEIDFGQHTVTVAGDHLDTLLEAVASHRVIRLLQPMQNEAKFNVRGTGNAKQTGRPVIHQIVIYAKQSGPGAGKAKSNSAEVE